MNTFSAGAMIRFGWDTFWKRPWFFVAVTVLIGIFSGISGHVTNVIGKPQSGTAVVVVGVGFLISFLIGLLIKMGSTHTYLKAHDNVEAVKFEDLWAPQHIVSFVIAAIFVAAIVIIGLILLVVPGIIWALRYGFVPYLVIDRGLDASSALSE